MNEFQEHSFLMQRKIYTLSPQTVDGAKISPLLYYSRRGLLKDPFRIKVNGVPLTDN